MSDINVTLTSAEVKATLTSTVISVTITNGYEYILPDDVVKDSEYVHTDNNYTNDEKTKLSTIAENAEVNVNADWNATDGDGQILNKPSTFPPSTHNHDDRYFTEDEVTNALALKADKTYVDNQDAALTAQLADIENKSLKVKNLITNGNFSNGIANWVPVNATISVNNGSLQIECNGTSAQGRANQVMTNSLLVEDNVIYIKATAMHISVNNPALQLVLRNSADSFISTLDQKTTTASNVIYNLSNIYKVQSLYNGQIPMVVLRSLYASPEIALNEISLFSKVQYINLTTIFGAGNEPTKSEMDTLINMIGWFDDEITVTEKQLAVWTLNLIRQNRNAIIALGGTIV